MKPWCKMNFLVNILNVAAQILETEKYRDTFYFTGKNRKYLVKENTPNVITNGSNEHRPGLSSEAPV